MSENLLSRAKVLIVDDEPSNIRLLERILEMFGGAKARSTTDSRDALRIYSDFQPDLVLLDLHMPHLDGFAIIEQIKAAVTPPDYLPILVLTADVTLATKRRALTTGAKDILTKPLDHFEVVLRMKNLLENRFLHQELQRQNALLEQQVHGRAAAIAETHDTGPLEHRIRRERLGASKSLATALAAQLTASVTVTLGNAELLLPYVKAHAPARELGYLHNVVAAAQDAMRAVDRLDEFSRRSMHDELRLPVQMNNLIEQAIAVILSNGQTHGADGGVHVDVVADLKEIPAILGNAPALQTAFLNMIVNSIEAMPNGGSVTVGSRADDAGVTVTVRDTGRGMSSEERQHCFEPFFTTKADNNSGLGLPTALDIIERHGGSLEIASEEGHGTTCTVKLPLATGELQQATRATPSQDRRALTTDCGGLSAN